MVAAAPARLSTTACWPSAFPSTCATGRAMRSVPLPADHGTIIRIGLAGYGCAPTAPIPRQKAEVRRQKIVLKTLITHHSSPRWQLDANAFGHHLVVAVPRARADRE